MYLTSGADPCRFTLVPVVRWLSVLLLVTISCSLGAGLVGLYEWRMAMVVAGWVFVAVGLAGWQRRQMRDAAVSGWRWGVALVVVPLVLTAVLWPRITGDGLNGDGTEASELARSLREHPLPRWEIETPSGGAAFGTPLAVPYITGAALAQVPMALVGESAVAVRVLMPICLGLLLVLVRARTGPLSATGWTYLALSATTYLVWATTWVSYDPPFDIAEPAGTNLLTTLLFVLGVLECVRGSVPLGAALWTAASLTTYGGPVLTLGALIAITWQVPERAKSVWWWTLLLSVVTLGGLAVWGTVTGDLAGWLVQIRDEYWHDLVDPGRRVAGWPVLVRWSVLLGVLPLAMLRGWSRVPPLERVFAITAGVYCVVVFAGADKALHYLMPVPFLVWPAALAASRRGERVLASGIAAAALVAGWPATIGPNPTPRLLGADSCIVDLDFEGASLASVPVEDALAGPREPDRLGISRHAWVRHTLDEQRGRCVIGLSPTVPPDATLLVDGTRASVWTRDLDAFVGWRFHPAGWTHAPLFRRAEPAPPPRDPHQWPDDIDLLETPGEALVIVSSDEAERRLLVPALTRSSWRIDLRARTGGDLVDTVVVVDPQPTWGIVAIADGYEPVRLRRVR